MDREESLEMMFVYFGKPAERKPSEGELLSGGVERVRSSLLCKCVPQTPQIWTVQMLTNVEADEPLFEKDKLEQNSFEKGAVPLRSCTGSAVRIAGMRRDL